MFVNLPSVGDACEGGENSIAEVESVKSCSPIYSPVRGEVIEINAEVPIALFDSNLSEF